MHYGQFVFLQIIKLWRVLVPSFDYSVAFCFFMFLLCSIDTTNGIRRNHSSDLCFYLNIYLIVVDATFWSTLLLLLKTLCFLSLPLLLRLRFFLVRTKKNHHDRNRHRHLMQASCKNLNHFLPLMRLLLLLLVVIHTTTFFSCVDLIGTNGIQIRLKMFKALHILYNFLCFGCVEMRRKEQKPEMWKAGIIWNEY